MSHNTAGSESQAGSAAPEAPALTRHLDRSLLLVMAVACGVFVANIYYNQPILELLQQAFPRAPGLVNLVPTATQLGFACGLFFLCCFVVFTVCQCCLSAQLNVAASSFSFLVCTWLI